MKSMRKGREFYGKNYGQAIKLHNDGMSVKDISEKLGVSYSAAYHWVKGIRKPSSGNVENFVKYLEENGPRPAIDIKEKFPKHNEVFLIATRRGLPVKRLMMQKKLGEYSIWYYVRGQEGELNARVDMLMEKVREVSRKLDLSAKGR